MNNGSRVCKICKTNTPRKYNHICDDCKRNLYPETTKQYLPLKGNKEKAEKCKIKKCRICGQVVVGRKKLCDSCRSFVQSCVNYPRMNFDRGKEIVRARNDGLTLKKIGQRFGISIERARQLISVYKRYEK